ncbi:MAG: Ig-like domain-containing protein [Gemmatimonadales bacterium]
MKAWRFLLCPIVMAGCSDLTAGAGGVVGLEIREPTVKTVEVAETVQLTATAIDKDGNAVAAPIEWRAPDPTLTVDANGAVTGVAPGTGRVQAVTGSLTSNLVTFTVVLRADTVVIVGDSVFTVPVGVTASAPLVVQVRNFATDNPLPGRLVVYAVTSPPDVGPHTVELPGGVLTDTLTTDANGTVSTVTLNRVNGTTQPATAFVQITALRPRGDPVPGSGQRFTVNFQ